MKKIPTPLLFPPSSIIRYLRVFRKIATYFFDFFFQRLADHFGLYLTGPDLEVIYSFVSKMNYFLISKEYREIYNNLQNQQHIKLYVHTCILASANFSKYIKLTLCLKRTKIKMILKMKQIQGII